MSGANWVERNMGPERRTIVAPPDEVPENHVHVWALQTGLNDGHVTVTWWSCGVSPCRAVSSERPTTGRFAPDKPQTFSIVY